MTLAVGSCTLSFDGSNNPVFGGSGMASSYMVQLQPVRLPSSTVAALRAIGTIGTNALTSYIATLVSECVALATAYVPYATNNTLVTVTASVGGLQTSTAVGNPTNAPGVPQNILGGIT